MSDTDEDAQTSPSELLAARRRHGASTSSNSSSCRCLRSCSRWFSAASSCCSPASASPMIGTAFAALFDGSFGSLSAVSETLTAAAPMTLAALGVALGFRAGLFNIGAEGQMILGGIAAVAVGFSLAGPAAVHPPAAGAPRRRDRRRASGRRSPGWLKAATGAHEVITTIMLNLIAVQLTDFLLRNPPIQKPGRHDPISESVLPSARASQAALLARPQSQDQCRHPHHAGHGRRSIYWLLFRTTLGFEFRASGLNPVGRALRRHALQPDHRRGHGDRRWRLPVSPAPIRCSASSAAPRRASPAAPASTPSRSRSSDDRTRSACCSRASCSARSRPAADKCRSRRAYAIDLIAIIQALIIVFVAAPLLMRAVFPWAFRKRRAGGDLTPWRPRPRPAAADLDHAARRQTLVIGWLLLGLAVLVAGVFGLNSPGDATFRLALPGDVIRRARTSSSRQRPTRYVVAAVLAFLGARQFVRGAARTLQPLLRHRALPRGDRVPRLGDGRQILLADRHARGDRRPRRADRARRSRRRPLASASPWSISASRACCFPAPSPERSSARCSAVGSGLLGGGRRRRTDGLHPRRAGHHLPRRPDHRRRRDQPVRARPDVLRDEPGADRASRAQQRADLPGYRRSRSSRDLPIVGRGPLPAEPLRLRRRHPRRGRDLLSVPHALRAAGPRGRRTPGSRRHARHQRLSRPLHQRDDRRHGRRLRAAPGSRSARSAASTST